MPQINKAFREVICKIVYYGPGAGGKTTNLYFIHSNVPSRHRGDLTSLATEQDRTLFFDHLPLDIGDIKGYKTKFQLYTVPGQVYYNATRKMVLKQVDGIVFVADSQPSRLQDNIDSLNNLIDNLRDAGQDLTTVPFVLQYNKRDLPGVLPIDELDQYLNPAGRFTIFEASALEGTGVSETLREVSALILKRLQENANIELDKDEIDARIGTKSSKAARAESPSSSGLYAASRNAPTLDIEQESRTYWRGLSVGGGTVSIVTLGDAPEGETDYNVELNHSIVGVPRRTDRRMRYIGQERIEHDGVEREFSVLREVSDARMEARMTAYVDLSGAPLVYLVYPGIFGEMKTGPAGEPIVV